MAYSGTARALRQQYDSFTRARLTGLQLLARRTHSALTGLTIRAAVEQYIHYIKSVIQIVDSAHVASPTYTQTCARKHTASAVSHHWQSYLGLDLAMICSTIYECVWN